MAEIMMTPIGENDVDARTVFNTGISTIGKGGDDYFCGHCGRKMITRMDLSRLEVPVVYQCGTCQGYNEPPASETDGDLTAAPATPPG